MMIISVFFKLTNKNSEKKTPQIKSSQEVLPYIGVLSNINSAHYIYKHFQSFCKKKKKMLFQW